MKKLIIDLQFELEFDEKDLKEVEMSFEEDLHFKKELIKTIKQIDDDFEITKIDKKIV